MIIKFLPDGVTVCCYSPAYRYVRDVYYCMSAARIPILATHTRYVTAVDYNNIVVVRISSYSSSFRTNILGLGLVRTNIVSFRLVIYSSSLIYRTVCCYYSQHTGLTGCT